ncbi:hypothetical protein [uncultured Duncaniella sp.]|uniref:hypothetical protein n=1 Tax=uncultured Duncaniella sp. TaxID=2768039 RepID=UPI0026ECABB7|nr:hypothetical protein [uncultured Duncaniella sp.]
MDLVLPYDDTVKPLPFYLAEEEWLARRFPHRDFFFIWQVEPTVIIGRNQLLDSEVNVGIAERTVSGWSGGKVGEEQSWLT